MTANFVRDLDQLKRDLLLMGALVEEGLTKAIAALVDRRADLVDEVLEGDHAIDGYETRIEETCIHMLALHQPVARDLRFILTVMKVNNELERMGDHAKNIAEAAEFLCTHEPLPIYLELDAMAASALVMVRESLDSMVNQDSELAGKVRRDDDVVDDAYEAILSHVSELMQRDPDMVECGMRVVTAAQNVERIGDIATNIAKDVLFLIEGQIVRHRNEAPQPPRA